jgi:membrane-bound lytic murein transglycosylase MltF
MPTQLTQQDLEFILESLKYTKLKFEDYQQYPSYEYKQGRVKEVQDVMSKVKDILRETKEDPSV